MYVAQNGQVIVLYSIYVLYRYSRIFIRISERVLVLQYSHAFEGYVHIYYCTYLVNEEWIGEDTIQYSKRRYKILDRCLIHHFSTFWCCLLCASYLTGNRFDSRLRTVTAWHVAMLLDLSCSYSA